MADEERPKRPSIDQIREQEAADVHIRGPLVIAIAKKAFEGTGLIEKKPIGSEELKAVFDFFETVAPFAHPKVFPDFWLHSMAAGLFAKNLAQIIGLDPQLQQAAVTMHDLSRIVLPHRYGRTDLFEKPLAHMIGIRDEVLATLVPLERLLAISSSRPLPQLAHFTPSQRVTLVADTLGKVDEYGHLGSPDEIRQIAESSRGRYKDPVWPSEAKYYGRYIDKKVFSSNIKLLEDCVEWLKQEHGVDFDKVRRQSEEELASPQSQSWYLRILDAQETLDPEIDKKLKRPPITNIVFDVGGVLFQVAEEELMKAISQKLDVSPDTFKRVFQRYYGAEYIAGRSDPGETLYHELGLPTRGKVETEDIFSHPNIYHPVEGMPEIIGELASNPDLQVILYSDAMAPLAKTVRAVIRDFYPQLRVDQRDGQVFISSQTRTSKIGKDAYEYILERLGNPDPQSVLFIDDNQTYTTSARAANNMRGFTFRGNPYKELTATQRLKGELQKGELLK